jgi:hypothetical protein
VSEITREQTFRYDIFMAGDIAQAKQVCREYCFVVGLCVHIERRHCCGAGGSGEGGEGVGSMLVLLHWSGNI